MGSKEKLWKELNPKILPMIERNGIVESLREELSRIDRAIAILDHANGSSRFGRATFNGRLNGKRRRHSAATMRKLAVAAKARWAAAKEAGRNSL
jgi:hypothetical protein